MLKIAAYQGPIFFSNMERSLEKIVSLLERADRENIDILCMPEGYLQGYFSDRQLAWQNAIDLSDSKFAELCKSFSSFSTTLLLGLNEKQDHHLYDTVVVIENGELKGRYRKAYPYHNYFTPGREFPVFEKKGIKYGIIICRDSTYFEPARILALGGASILFCPMCNKASSEYHESNHAKLRRQKSHLIARSFENHAWVVASDIIYPHDGKEVCAGYACIYNQEGEEVASAASFQEAFLVHEIALEEKKKTRIYGCRELVNILHEKQREKF